MHTIDIQLYRQVGRQTRKHYLQQCASHKRDSTFGSWMSRACMAWPSVTMRSDPMKGLHFDMTFASASATQDGHRRRRGCFSANLYPACHTNDWWFVSSEDKQAQVTVHRPLSCVFVWRLSQRPVTAPYMIVTALYMTVTTLYMTVTTLYMTVTALYMTVTALYMTVTALYV